jgi:predicted nucleic acid-binding Zn ribbon protein
MVSGPFSFPPRRSPPPRSSPRQRALAQWRGWNWSGDEIARQASGKKAAAVLPRVLADLRMDRRQAEAEIVRVWSCQMDPNIVAHAQPAGIRNGTLFVTVDSSVWLDEIVRYRRREILERLQNSFGRELIRRISFRLG